MKKILLIVLILLLFSFSASAKILILNPADANFINISISGNAFGGTYYGTWAGDPIAPGFSIDTNFQTADYVSVTGDSNFGNVGISENLWVSFLQDGLHEPTGFPNKCSDVTISFTDGTKTFSIQPSGASFDIFYAGIKFTKTSEETIITTDEEGAHYIYYDGSGTLQENATPSFSEIEEIIGDEVAVAVFYWDTTANQAIYFTGTNECHGTKMDGAVHAFLHFSSGTLFISGLAVGDITADDTGDNATHAQLSITDGIIEDEDILQNIIDDTPQNLSIPANLPIFYRSGVSNWKKIVATDYPITTTGSGRSAWNQFTGGAWQLTEVTNNQFVLSHIFATNNFSEPVVVIVGQSDYSTLTSAREGSATEINNLVTSGLGFQEFVPIATIIFQTNNGYGNAVKSRIRTTDLGDNYIDWRFSQINPSTTPGSVLNLTDIGTDFASQYVLDAGDWMTGDLNISTDLNALNVLVRGDLNVIGDSNFANISVSGNTFLNALFTTTLTVTGDANFSNIGVSENSYFDGNLNVAQIAFVEDFNVTEHYSIDWNGSEMIFTEG